MKKRLSFLLAVLMLISSVCVFGTAVSEPRKNIFSYQMPTTARQTAQRFTKSFGSGYKNAPTPPLVVGNTLIVLSGKTIYKLDCENGEVLAKASMYSDVGFATTSPTYYGGVIYAALDNGIVQAFSYKTLESLWIYQDALGGQALCPITYDGGYLYTGFWRGEENYANYVCLSAKDENTKKTNEKKSPVWVRKNKGGYYWAGAAITKNYAVFGCDNGNSDSTSTSRIISVNKKTGKLAGTLSVKGDIRSAVTYYADTGCYYVSSKAGYVYKFKMNSSTGAFSSLRSFKAPGEVTATPVIYAGRLYVGAQNGQKGQLLVLDASTLKKIYHADVDGYPQSTVTVCDAYYKDTGKVYVYATLNNNVGSVVVLEDSAGQKSGNAAVLYKPGENKRQYCISPISVGSDGTLYYKNDSGYIFAVEKSDHFNVINEFLIKMVSLYESIIKALGF
ncbi:MAG: PQQ-binding-like beta-propeller repeat protein [Acutalibacteraceae bacterium]